MFEEILLEKLASHFDEEDLELLAAEAAAEAEAEEAEKSASDELSDDDAMVLAEYLGEEETAALIEEVEAEKTASIYYEMGQTMARGFQEELEKLSAEKEAGEMPPQFLAKKKGEGKDEEKKDDKKDDKKEDKKEEEEEEKKSSDSDVYRALAVLSDAGVLDKIASSEEDEDDADFSEGSDKIAAGYLKATKRLGGVLKSMYRRGKAVAKSTIKRPKKIRRAKRKLVGQAKEVAKGLAIPAAVGTGAYVGKKTMDKLTGKEKKSSSAEIYQALSVLAEAGLLEE